MRSYTEYHLIHGWSLILLAVLTGAAFLAFRWRRVWLPFLAALSAISGVILLALLPMTWTIGRSAGLTWSIGGSGGTTLAIGSSHGTLRFAIGINTGGAPLRWPGRLVVFRDPDYGPFSARRNGPTSYIPFLEQPLGLQIGHARTEDPGIPRISNTYEIVIPHWLFVFLFCPWFPLIWHLRRRRRLRTQGFPVAAATGEASQAQPPPVV